MSSESNVGQPTNPSEALRSFFRSVSPWSIWRRRSFRQIFRFSPVERCPQTLQSQRRVDEVLTELAGQARLWFNRQETARREWKAFPGEVDIGWYNKRVGKAKGSFWRAHNLARAFGFSVEHTVSAYVEKHHQRPSA